MISELLERPPKCIAYQAENQVRSQIVAQDKITQNWSIEMITLIRSNSARNDIAVLRIHISKLHDE